MKLRTHGSRSSLGAPRLILIGLGVVVLCSCRSMDSGNLLNLTKRGSGESVAKAQRPRTAPPSPAPPNAAVQKAPAELAPQVAQVAYQTPVSPAAHSATSREAVVGEVSSTEDCPPGYAAAFHGGPYWGPGGLPGEYAPYDLSTGPWQPPGLQGPWPYDEYIYDGGDRETFVDVLADWTVRGLEQEDTVAHYDRVDGRTVVVPSNRIPIYAPRFAAVRKVYGLEVAQQRERISGVEVPTKLNKHEDVLIATTAIQQHQPDVRLATRTPVDFRERNLGVEVGVGRHLGAFHNWFMPFEDFLFVRQGIFEQSEKARLAESIEAAQVWTGKQAAQVLVDGIQAAVATGDLMPNEAVRVEESPRPKLRIIKLASRLDALPGEIIDFTLRFDNVGNEVVGNVTVLDNLTTRLDFVPGSDQCSLKSEFKPVPNEGDTMILRWEISDPLEKGQGGIIRFKCRVR
jgi:uncharacterized repeat protein (TIGR01451 family)